MYASPRYPVTDEQVEAFVSSMLHGTVIASPPDGHPQASILPFVKVGDQIELHFVRKDPVFAALRQSPRCTFLVSDYLAFTPHDFVDPVDAGRATLHFRAVSYFCEAHDISTDPAAVAGALSRLLSHHEPGASYDEVQVNQRYEARLRMLGTARLTVVGTQAKFKTGPADTREVKRLVIDRLRQRGDSGDRRAAEVIESYLD